MELDETITPFPTCLSDFYAELEEMGAPTINDYELEECLQ